MESKIGTTQADKPQNDTPSANREIKDGVFKLLFEKPENAAELYYALTGVECIPEEIQIITLTNTISGKLKNDLAFVVRGKALVVGEHQSTPNKNMPIRILMYLGQLYEKWFKMKGEERFLYRSDLYKIPTPEFVVFYNGTEKRPTKEVLHLSDAFEYKQDGDLGFLKLEVPVYNINKGMGDELFEKSDKLKHYAEFIFKIRELNETYNDFVKAVMEAVKHCIANNILAEFLKEIGGKIVSILTMEYDVEVAKKVYAEERAEEIARRLLRRGNLVETVAEDTGLDVATVRQLKSELESE
jgi:hypothetical protein